MPSISQVTLLGHLARDPDLRYTPQGKAVANLTVAVNHRYTRHDGEKVDEVAFVDVTVWERQAEACAEYLKKGRAVLVLGRLTQDRWEDEKTQEKRSKLRVIAHPGGVQFLGGGSKDEESPEAHEETLPEETPAPAPPKKEPTKAKK